MSTENPAEVIRVAHSTAAALLGGARDDDTGQTAERLISYALENGIEEIAELWSAAAAKSLPGALWRLYALQASVRSDPATAALLYERGRAELPSVDAVVAGAPAPASPNELGELIDTILRGAFRGDFGVALERAAAYCRVQASGATYVADDYEATDSTRASELTARALRLSAYASDLDSAARAGRAGTLG